MKQLSSTLMDFMWVICFVACTNDYIQTQNHFRQVSKSANWNSCTDPNNWRRVRLTRHAKSLMQNVCGTYAPENPFTLMSVRLVQVATVAICWVVIFKQRPCCFLFVIVVVRENDSSLIWQTTHSHAHVRSLNDLSDFCSNCFIIITFHQMITFDFHLNI